MTTTPNQPTDETEHLLSSPTNAARLRAAILATTPAPDEMAALKAAAFEVLQLVERSQFPASYDRLLALCEAAPDKPAANNQASGREGILPCPFCGVSLRKMSEAQGYWHPKGNCTLADFHFEDDSYSRERWNTRALAGRLTKPPAPIIEIA